MTGTGGGVRTGAVVGGFDAEGGYNGPGQPAHSWCRWEAEGRAPRPAGRFWRDGEAELARVAAAGFDSVRVSVEWARCEPHPGRLDLEAVARYGRLLDRCHEYGLQPVVVLHRLAHPAWLGVDLWLQADAAERFSSWVGAAVHHLADRAHRWVTVDRLNAGALCAYLSGRHPPGRRLDVAATVRSLDNRLAAHVLAHQAVRQRQPQGVVSTGNRHLPVYELDRLLVDVLLGRGAGVGRHELYDWLHERRRAHQAGPDGAGGRVARALRKLVGDAVPLSQALPRAVAAVYDAPDDRCIDVLEVAAEPGDVRRLLPLPGGGRRARCWADHGGELLAACRAAAGTGLPLSVVGDRPVGARTFRRRRAEVEAAAGTGAPVVAYCQRLSAAGLGALAADAVVTAGR